MAEDTCRKTFSPSEPLYAFSEDCRDRIQNYVGKHTNYGINHLIFTTTIEKGKFIESFFWFNNYTVPSRRGKDNLNDPVRLVDLGDGGPPLYFKLDPAHHSTKSPYSSTHGDLSLQKGNDPLFLPNLAATCPHTGIPLPNSVPKRRHVVADRQELLEYKSKYAKKQKNIDANKEADQAEEANKASTTQEKKPKSKRKSK